MISKEEIEEMKRRVEKARREGKSTHPEDLASEEILPTGYEVDVGV